LALGLCVALLGAGCAVGIDHRVQAGENLYRIGKAYGIDYQELARLNRIYAPYRISAGSELFIPGASRQLPVTVITPKAVNTARPARPTTTPSGKSVSTGFAWPVEGRVSSRFGARERGYHDGIDISAPRGAPVRAARPGKVIFSDRLSGYGNVIIVEHPGGYTSVYANNERNLVAKGRSVHEGERIATIGSSGRASGPQLHFEIRKDNVARNPIYYLPGGSTATSGAAR
jgi:lipoprotein NlpD